MRPLRQFLSAVKRATLGSPAPNQALEQERTDAEIAGEVEKYLSSTIGTGKSAANQAPRQPSQPSQPFEDFLDRYQTCSNQSQIAGWKSAHPVLCELCDRLIEHFKMCETQKGPMSGLLRRLSSFVLPFQQNQAASLTYSYRDQLPKAGLLFNINHEPRSFIVDALEGSFVIEELDYETVIKRGWGERPYEYLASLKKIIEQGILELPNQFVQRFPSKDWLAQHLTYHAQTQISLFKLIEQNAWDILVIGATDVPICMALLDLPKEKRPKLFYLCHGLPYGDPMPDLFLDVDFVLARGGADETYFRECGFREDRIVRIGSLSHEGFPPDQILEERRAQARLKMGITADSYVILYALSYDLFAYKTLSVEQIQQLVIETLSKAAAQTDKEIVLLLKYHPAPTNEPHFSYSRLQYRLETFLAQQGYSTRLVKELDQSLPAADCCIAHESTVLCDALFNGAATMSLNFQKSEAKPLLGNETYQITSSHKFNSIYDDSSELASDLLSLMKLPRNAVYSDCRKAWQTIFDCGRTEGLVRFSNLALASIGQAPTACESGNNNTESPSTPVVQTKAETVGGR